MTVGIEILAEVAALVLPGKRVAEIANIEMSRWLALEEDHLVVELTATRRDADSVDVQLREAGADHTPSSLRGTIVFRDALPPSPQAPELVLLEPKPSAATDPTAIYGDPRMFHGPLFQSLRRASQSGRNGIVAQLVNPASIGFFRTRRSDRLLIHPALLDGMGQAIGCWVFDYFELESVFPLRVARLQWFGDTIEAGSPVTCQVRIRPLQGLWLEADLELIDARGLMIAAVEGWINRRVRVSGRLYAFLLDPGRAFLCAPLATQRADGVVRCRVALDDLSAELSDGGMIWLRTMVHTVLTAAERKRWYRLPGDVNARVDWLAIRVAAKDAVRLLIRETDGCELHAAEIDIEAAGSTLVARCDGLRRPPSITIDRERGRLVAVAALEEPASATPSPSRLLTANRAEGDQRWMVT
jgi:hypothetical protein